MKNKNLIESFNHAITGLIHAIKNERNMKIHIFIAAAVVLLSFFYDLNRQEIIVILITISIVLICELFNTAIEAFVDALIDTYHPKAKVVKDTAAAAVLISALMSLGVAYFIFFNRLSTSLEIGIVRLKNTPVHITALAVAITTVLVVVIKMLTKTGTPLRGGMPSGHSAVAMSITTAVGLWTENPAITLLVLMISLLVIQSRFEAKFHTILELVLGGILGIAVTVLVFLLL